MIRQRFIFICGAAAVSLNAVLFADDSNDYRTTAATPPATGRACPTCFYANGALAVAEAGVKCYAQQGVPASKLVMAWPWCAASSLPQAPAGCSLHFTLDKTLCRYGYEYTCSAGDTLGECNVTESTQVSLSDVPSLLAIAAPPGRIWNAASGTPHFFYRACAGGGLGCAAAARTELRRVDYDDSESLRLKQPWAVESSRRRLVYFNSVSP